MDKRTATTILVIAAAVGAVLMLRARGRMPTLTLSERAVGQSWSPYCNWLHQSPAGFIHHFPDQVGANCLPLVYQQEDMGQALNHVEVDGAACAQ